MNPASLPLTSSAGAILGRLAQTLAAPARSMASEPVTELYQRLTRQVIGNFNLDEILGYVLDQAADLFGADRAFLALVDEQGEPIYSLMRGSESRAGTLLPHSRALIEWVRTEQRALWSPDVSRDPHWPARLEAQDLHAVVALPLIIEDQVVGVLYLDQRSPRKPVDTSDFKIVEGLAAYATLAIFNVRSHNETQAHLRKLQRINEVSVAISGLLELDPLLALILQHSLSLSGGEQGYILLGTPDDLTCLASLNREGQPIENVSISRSIAARCLEENRAICILDTHQDLDSLTRSVMALDLRSVISVPLVANQQPIGVLYISSQAITKTFTPQDQALLEAIASQAALAIRNAQLLKEQERQIVELENALRQVKEAQLKAVTDGMTGLYNHVYFKEQLYNSVLAADRYGQPLSVVMVDLDHFKRINDTYGHQAGDEVLRQVSATLVKLTRDCDVLARYGGEEMAVLLPQTTQQGAVVVAERIREAIQALEITSLEGERIPVTASLGVAGHRPGLAAVELVERADKALYVAKHGGRNQVCCHGQTVRPSTDGAREAQRTQPDIFLQALQLLAEELLARDSANSAELKALTRRFGEAMNMRERELKELELAVLLRDIGMLGVPEGVRQKPGPLDGPEWDLVHGHPSQGARLTQIAYLPGISQAVRYHHERWDGAGYPDGLHGTEIPLIARMVAILDAYWAMQHDRPFRGRLGRSEALEELKKGSGVQYDPELVGRFLACLETEQV